MIINNGIMVGQTSLDTDKTFQHASKKGLDVVCRQCAKPFVESLQENGIVNDTVVCSLCGQEMAFIVPE